MENIGGALENAKVVIIPAGVPRRPGITRDDLFTFNAKIVATLATACAKFCPDACFLIISNPVNSLVPLFASILEKAGVYNPKHLFGITTLDIIRAKRFVTDNLQWSRAKAKTVSINVIGGHAGATILPLLSQIKDAKFSENDLENLTYRIRFAGDEVLAAKDKVRMGGGATLSMAYAGVEFCSKLIRALNGEKGITECAYVDLKKEDIAESDLGHNNSNSLQQDDVQGARFFSTPVTLGVNGVECINKFGLISEKEQLSLNEMLPTLKKQIEKGVQFAKEYKDDVEYKDIKQSHETAKPILVAPNQGQVAK